ncbi:hypothetical protein N7471_008891 [Penicillium samsonianum]|uniref:uncharacterized protein n=1 Tax=Penicillium samsonianum TaxID=1882272 RepID=UPI0025476806|nr:uncharacterized protein N7471_008891 [Penicillium samsonianum]KAJ6133676.1 hypothetical protein N7471_008891 [Penicillium samsonianum]
MARVKSMLNSWPDLEQEFPADEYIKPLDSFMRVRNALDVKKNNFHMIINCHDNWLVYSHDEAISDGEGGQVLSRMYHDTRIQDQNVYMSHTMTCHERPSMRGYTWENKFTGKEETVYCPDSFPMWNGRHIADRQSSTFASMKGKTFKDVKEYAAASTMLHEVTHSPKTLGDHSTEDVRITYQGRTYPAYGGPLCRELAMTFTDDIGYPELNADTLALFGLGVYYSQCNWANSDKPGKCWTDTPDKICPTVNNQRTCVTFDWDA